VVEPGQATPPGTARILALCDAFLSYVERRVFLGGCFMCSVAAEVNVRPGPVRDRIVEFAAGWLQTIEVAVREAQSRDEIAPEIDPAQLAFETDALLIAASLAFPLFGDRTVLQLAQLGVRDRLGRLLAGQRRTQVPCRPGSAMGRRTDQRIGKPGRLPVTARRGPR
jgi:hypothetical protein